MALETDPYRGEILSSTTIVVSGKMALETDPYRGEMAQRRAREQSPLRPPISRGLFPGREPALPVRPYPVDADAGFVVPPKRDLTPQEALEEVAEIKTALFRLSLQLTRVEGMLKEVLARDQSRPIEYDDAPLMQ
ncbi:MAG TPA: hypothetical protein HA263_08125 [Methanoregulaceae archaeon]|nr:hypothetical protein [Methanoregulaceae archaeon]